VKRASLPLHRRGAFHPVPGAALHERDGAKWCAAPLGAFGTVRCTASATRRELLMFFAGTATAPVAWPVAADAQQAAKVRRIGFLWDSPAAFPEAMAAFRRQLRDLGYVEGRNLVIEHRWAEGKPDRMRDMAAELTRLLRPGDAVAWTGLARGRGGRAGAGARAASAAGAQRERI